MKARLINRLWLCAAGGEPEFEMAVARFKFEQIRHELFRLRAVQRAVEGLRLFGGMGGDVEPFGPQFRRPPAGRPEQEPADAAPAIFGRYVKVRELQILILGAAGPILQRGETDQFFSVERAENRAAGGDGDAQSFREKPVILRAPLLCKSDLLQDVAAVFPPPAPFHLSLIHI